MNRDKKQRALDALVAGGFPWPEALEMLNGPSRQAFKERDLRDEFAIAALQGICAHPDTLIRENEQSLAVISYEVADAMMKARG